MYSFYIFQILGRQSHTKLSTQKNFDTHFSIRLGRTIIAWQNYIYTYPKFNLMELNEFINVMQLLAVILNIPDESPQSFVEVGC